MITILDAAEEWALLHDPNQWIVARARTSRCQREWRPMAFIASNKTKLRSHQLETGIETTPEAKAIINGMPERFLDFISESAADEEDMQKAA